MGKIIAFLASIAFIVLAAASVALAAGFTFPVPAWATDGGIVVVRQVPPRVAYRKGEPGQVTSRGETSPRREVSSGLGIHSRHKGAAVSGELGNDEYASVTAGTGRVGALPEADRAAAAWAGAPGPIGGSYVPSGGPVGVISRTPGDLGRAVAGATANLFGR